MNSDVVLMAELFRERGFDVRVHVDGDASRSRIIAAYEQLIVETPIGSTDPVVLYYSGHGGRAPLPGWQELQRSGKRSHLRFLVPFDMDASTENDFRGLLAEEISHLQRRLTAKTANVTTILDCCHSGTMSRGADLGILPKAVSRNFPTDGALPLLEAIDAAALDRPREFDDANHLAVRVVACDPLQSAYERNSVLGGRHGALTEQLVIAIRALGDRPASWQVLGELIRRNIAAELPLQRPEVEGPAMRLPFSLTTRGEPGALPVTVAGDGLTIEPA
ncbi:MAG: caspase family protein, partial [Mycobacterium sp.]